MCEYCYFWIGRTLHYYHIIIIVNFAQGTVWKGCEKKADKYLHHDPVRIENCPSTRVSLVIWSAKSLQKKKKTEGGKHKTYKHNTIQEKKTNQTTSKKTTKTKKSEWDSHTQIWCLQLILSQVKSSKRCNSPKSFLICSSHIYYHRLWVFFILLSILNR